MKKKKSNRNEIVWNIINSLLAGMLVLFGNFASGEITIKGLCAAFAAFFIVAITQFKNYWDGEKGEYANHLFAFVTA
jgi:hypothetical protein